MSQNNRQHTHTHSGSESLGEQIVQTINNFLCPVRVRFGRIDKVKLVLEGRLMRCTLNETKRKGGGFIFWIVYRSQLVPHKTALKWMLEDYCTHIEEKRRLTLCKLKPVKNLTINASKDILIEPEGHLPVPLSIVIPCSIRDMKNQSECNQWISKVSSQGLGAWFSGYSPMMESDDQQLDCAFGNDIYSLRYSLAEVTDCIEQLRSELVPQYRAH